MEFLNQYLDSDTLEIICKFLINSDDYTPFTLEDIKRLDPHIYNWAGCMKWAARSSNLPMLKYASKKPQISKITWERCAETAAAHGKLDAFKYCASRSFQYGWSTWQIGVFCAIKHGHSHVAQYASNHFSVRDWGECVLSSASCGNIDLVKYFETKCLQSKTERRPPWEECFSIAKKKNYREIMKYSQEKMNRHTRKTVGC
jgi:hypothetical protein